jgi:hypothetical protein
MISQEEEAKSERRKLESSILALPYTTVAFIIVDFVPTSCWCGVNIK